MSTKTYPSSFRIVAKSIEMVDGYETINFPHYAGSITVPTLTDNNNGTATISATSGYIFDSVDYSGTLLFGTVEEQTFTFTDGAEEYVVIDYNNGNPIMRKETNKFLINGSNIITIFIVWRQGTKIHSINQGAFGLGLSNKINRMLYNVDNIFYPSLDLVSQNMSVILQLPIPFKLQEKTDMKVSAIATASGAISTMVLGWIENN